MIKIFNGVNEIEIYEGAIFDLPKVWTWAIGEEVTFSIDDNIEIVTRVVNLTGSGTVFQVISIITDELTDIKMNAANVEFFSINTIEHPISGADNDILTLEINNKTTKKKLIEYIDDYSLSIDKKLSKKDMLEAFNNYDGVKII